MIKVYLPYSKVMVEQDDSESPWGNVDIINPLLHEWLDERDPDWNWDIEDKTFQQVMFKVKDAGLAVLFKLTFG